METVKAIIELFPSWLIVVVMFSIVSTSVMKLIVEYLKHKNKKLEKEIEDKKIILQGLQEKSRIKKQFERIMIN